MAQLKSLCTVANASASVTLAGDHTLRIRQNTIFFVDGEFVAYTVAADATHAGGETTVTLTAPYAGASALVRGVFTTDILPGSRIPLLFPGDIGVGTVYSEGMRRAQDAYLVQDPDASAAAAANKQVEAAASAITADAARVDAQGSVGTARAAVSALSTSAASAYLAGIDPLLTGQRAVDAAAATAASAAAAQGSAGDAASAATATASARTATQIERDAARDWANDTGKTWALGAGAALNGRFTYRGDWNASNGTFPVPIAPGDYYRISTPGLISLVGYSAGDAIIYNGSSWDRIRGSDIVASWQNVPGLPAALAALAASGHTHAFADLTDRPTDFAGYGIVDGLAASNPVITRKMGVRTAQPLLSVEKTDEPGGAGRFRWGVQGGTFSVLRNTAAEGDFATESAVLTATAVGDQSLVEFMQPPKVGANSVWTSSFDHTTKADAAGFKAEAILATVRALDGAGSGVDVSRFDGGDIETYARPGIEQNFIINLRVQGHQVWHYGNLKLVKSVNLIGPDEAGNVQISPPDNGGGFCGMMVGYYGTLWPNTWVLDGVSNKLVKTCTGKNLVLEWKWSTQKNFALTWDVAPAAVSQDDFYDSFTGAGSLQGRVTDSGHTWLQPSFDALPLSSLTLNGSGEMLAVSTGAATASAQASWSPVADSWFVETQLRFFDTLPGETVFAEIMIKEQGDAQFYGAKINLRTNPQFLDPNQWHTLINDVHVSAAQGTWSPSLWSNSSARLWTHIYRIEVIKNSRFRFLKGVADGEPVPGQPRLAVFYDTAKSGPTGPLSLPAMVRPLVSIKNSSSQNNRVRFDSVRVGQMTWVGPLDGAGDYTHAASGFSNDLVDNSSVGAGFMFVFDADGTLTLQKLTQRHTAESTPYTEQTIDGVIPLGYWYVNTIPTGLKRVRWVDLTDYTNWQGGGGPFTNPPVEGPWEALPSSPTSDSVGIIPGFAFRFGGMFSRLVRSIQLQIEWYDPQLGQLVQVAVGGPYNLDFSASD